MGKDNLSPPRTLVPSTGNPPGPTDFALPYSLSLRFSRFYIEQTMIHRNIEPRIYTLYTCPIHLVKIGHLSLDIYICPYPI